MADPLLRVDCAPECGFVVQSHDRRELATLVEDHALKFHQKTVTDADVFKMAKSVRPM